MEELVNRLNENTKLIIKGEKYLVKTKTWYSIDEDSSASYIKCELSNNKVLVIIPDDELIYIGNVVENIKYERVSSDRIIVNNILFKKTGSGHQYITKIEFGNEDEIEGRCIFEDFETDQNIISLGILTDKDNKRADVYAEIIDLNDISIQDF